MWISAAALIGAGWLVWLFPAGVSDAANPGLEAGPLNPGLIAYIKLAIVGCGAAVAADHGGCAGVAGADA